MSEYDQEQISELDFARYVPKNEITRINSEDWHEKKGGKFAVPEASVLSVSYTSRYWAGRQGLPTINSLDEGARKGEMLTGDLSLAEIAPERPYRLAICGYELHRALEIIFGAPVSLNNNVWIWPFKHFVTYESQIRQRLKSEQELVREIEKDRRDRDNVDPPNGAADCLAERTPTEYGSYDFKDRDNSEGSEDQQKYASALRLEGQLRCLVRFMDSDMKELFSVKQSISDGTLRNIRFEYLWLLFKPGDLIFTSSAQRRAYRVLHVTGGRAILDIGEQPPLNNRNATQTLRSWEQHEDQASTYAYSKNTPFVIDAFYIDFDGDGFGPVPRKFVIQEYIGEQPICTLPAFPARFEENIQETEKMLTKRGRRFAKMAGVAHKKYSGLSAREPSVADWQEEVSQMPVKERHSSY